MSTRLVAGLIALIIAPIAGCERFTPAAAPAAQAPAKPAIGGVGVVDLDVVAKELGRDVEMATATTERLEALNTKLTSLQESLITLRNEKRDSIGEEPTEEQQQQLLAMQQRIEQQLLEAKRKAEVDLASFRQGLVDEFREEARPILTQVAAARGLSLVVPKNNALLLSIDPTVELTDEVVQKMRAAKPAADNPPEQTARAPRKRRAADDADRG